MPPDVFGIVEKLTKYDTSIAFNKSFDYEPQSLGRLWQMDWFCFWHHRAKVDG